MLGVVHFQVGTVDGIGQRVGTVHAANADGGLEVRAARHGDALHPAANLLQAGSKNVRGDAGEEQQKLVPAVADEDVATPDAVDNAAHDQAQRFVAGLVAVGVVDGLKIVHVDHRYALGIGESLALLGVIAAVVGVGQGVAVEGLAVGTHVIAQQVAAVHGQQRVFFQLTYQFQYAGGAVHLNILGKHLIGLAVVELQLGDLAMLGKGAEGRTVAAGQVLVPHRMAGVIGRF